MNSLLNLPKNVYLLCLAQIIGMCAISVVSLTGGLIGVDIAPSHYLVTLPATLMLVGLAIATIPAVMLMKKIGRRKGFMLSNTVAIGSCLLAANGVAHGNFYLFCFAALLLGTNGAFVQQYRFAALESVPKFLSSKAVSIVLSAGVISGFLGPEIAKVTKSSFSHQEYAGAYIALSLLFLVAVALVFLTKNISIHDEKDNEKQRPLLQIVTQPLYLLAVMSACVGYGVMLFIMTATPIFMNKMSHFGLDMTVMVIQSHVIAMFLPSFFTGFLIQKFGIFKIMISGLVSFCITIIFATVFHTLIPYWLALVCLGIGWNFLYISSTLLLSQTYRHSERFKAQGINDFAVVLSQMIASFFAGSLLFTAGWININLLTIPLIVGTFIVFIVYRRKLAFAPAKS